MITLKLSITQPGADGAITGDCTVTMKLSDLTAVLAAAGTSVQSISASLVTYFAAQEAKAKSDAAIPADLETAATGLASDLAAMAQIVKAASEAPAFPAQP